MRSWRVNLPLTVFLLFVLISGGTSCDPDGLSEEKRRACQELLEVDQEMSEMPPLEELEENPFQPLERLEEAASATGDPDWEERAGGQGLERAVRVHELKYRDAVLRGEDPSTLDEQIDLRFGYYGGLCGEADVDGFEGTSTAEIEERFDVELPEDF